MRAILPQIAQAMTIQAHSTAVQDQAMMAQANRDFAPRPHQQVTIVASRLREFT